MQVQFLTFTSFRSILVYFYGAMEYIYHLFLKKDETSFKIHFPSF